MSNHPAAWIVPVRWATMVLVVVLLVDCRTAGAADHATAHQTRADDSLSLGSAKQTLVVYRYDGVPRKPYAEKLFTPTGRNVLRDAPRDHVHHHGLMFAVAVEGVDFWQEVPKDKMGRQVHCGFLPPGYKPPVGVLPSGLCEKLEWQAPDGTPLLIERRTVDVDERAGPKVTLVTWTSQLSPAPGKRSVRLSGSHYFGLGMRLVASMDKGGRFLYADSSRDEAIRGTEHVVRARWAAYTASVDGRPVTVAVFDHPANPRHPAGIFTMSRPFAYLSATLGLHREPLTLKAERPLELKYGVVLRDGSVKAERIESLYRRWVGVGKSSPRITTPPLPHEKAS